MLNALFFFKYLKKNPTLFSDISPSSFGRMIDSMTVGILNLNIKKKNSSIFSFFQENQKLTFIFKKQLKAVKSQQIEKTTGQIQSLYFFNCI